LLDGWYAADVETGTSRQAMEEAFAPAQMSSEHIELRDLRIFVPCAKSRQGSAFACGACAQVPGEIVLLQYF